MGLFLAAGGGRKDFGESVKYMTISGEFKQTAGIQSRLGKVFFLIWSRKRALCLLKKFIYGKVWRRKGGEQKHLKFGKKMTLVVTYFSMLGNAGFLLICCSHFLVCIIDTLLILNKAPLEKEAICMCIELFRLEGLRSFHCLFKYLKVMGI